MIEDNWKFTLEWVWDPKEHPWIILSYRLEYIKCGNLELEYYKAYACPGGVYDILACDYDCYIDREDGDPHFTRVLKELNPIRALDDMHRAHQSPIGDDGIIDLSDAVAFI